MNKQLLPLLLINFMATLGFSIVLPFLFILVDAYGGNAFIYGLLGASFSLFQLFGAPLLGNWSDKVGRKKVLFYSQAGTMIAWILFLISFYVDENVIIVISLPLIVLFLARILDGITGGNIAVANAYLADITSPEDRTKNFGLMGMSASLGFMIGPSMAGLLGGTSLGLQLPVIISILISLIVLVLTALFLQNNTHINPKITGLEEKEFRQLSFIDAFKMPEIGFLLVINFFVFLSFNFFYISFPVYSIKEIGWTEIELGFFLTFLSIIMLISQGPVLSRVNKLISTPATMTLGFFLLGVGFILITYGDFAFLVASAIFVALGNGLSYPSLISTISNHTSTENQGAIQGISGSIGSLASIIGLIFGGLFYELLKAIIFYVSGFIMFLLVLLGIRFIFMEEKHIEHDQRPHGIHSLKKSWQQLPHIIHSIPKRLQNLEEHTIQHLKSIEHSHE